MEPCLFDVFLHSSIPRKVDRFYCCKQRMVQIHCLLFCNPWFVLQPDFSPADVSVVTDVFDSREHLLFEPKKNSIRIIQKYQLSAVENSQRLDSGRVFFTCSTI